ncbi:hypothetical protein TVAG_094960 [Trichomonas vaginalis G3]|uniref:Uncharacterized protein n=1 Tax=Trichomonas vaginalis (strain ATCC PRA-98 / G3) TaxID=412133 RepID=A2FZD9_TRIV3|nr:hypothetical protein TVAGG3_0724060 [Trichomonas vaginalis G3]EAX89731.1 hypothetical protein TVAG_094960 [Trichomonas vaginalis G3]KAI5510785.1 hypothetical protein TVAGG3_0724060 [Trichomonas vaginalis G3]|eukprot:XP_001302661.1 hypothetical protein [Trichomonas vaginalis G3]
MIEDSLHTANILNNSGVQQPIKQSLPSLNRFQTPLSARSKKVVIDDKSLNKMKFNIRMRVLNRSTERMKK